VAAAVSGSFHVCGVIARHRPGVPVRRSFSADTAPSGIPVTRHRARQLHMTLRRLSARLLLRDIASGGLLGMTLCGVGAVETAAAHSLLILMAAKGGVSKDGRRRSSKAIALRLRG